MAIVTRLVAAFSAIVLLAGCGGGSAPPTAGSAAGSSSGGRLPTQLSFIIPTAASSTASRRRNTLPSTTQSVVLTFTGSYGTALVPAVAAVTINTSTCTTVSTGLQCTTTANLPFGPVVGSVAAFAGANGAGALLALGTLTLNVATGATAAVTLTTASNYQVLSQNQLSATLSIDHAADTFTVNTTTGTGAAETLSGTIVPLANGDLQATVTNNGGSSGDPVGDVILLRELPNGVAIIEDSGTVAPASPWSGLSSTGGAALGVATPACATASGTFPIDLVSIAGSSFTAAGSSASQALIVGGATLTPTTLVGSGTAYDINGNSQGTTASGTVTCSGGNVYVPPVGSTTQPTLAFNNLGVIIGANGNGSNNSNPQVIGEMGFANPVSANIAALSAASYDGFVTSGNGGSNPTVQPATASMSATGLQLCSYTDVLNNVAATGTNCVTITFVSQPYPGVLYGSVSNGSVVVVTVAPVSGKYAIFGVVDASTSTTPGAAGNLVLFQH